MQAIGRIENGPLVNLSCLSPHALVDHANQICERSGILSSISPRLTANRHCCRSAFYLLELSSIISTGFVTAAPFTSSAKGSFASLAGCAVAMKNRRRPSSIVKASRQQKRVGHAASTPARRSRVGSGISLRIRKVIY